MPKKPAAGHRCLVPDTVKISGTPLVAWVKNAGYPAVRFFSFSAFTTSTLVRAIVPADRVPAERRGPAGHSPPDIAAHSPVTALSIFQLSIVLDAAPFSGLSVLRLFGMFFPTGEDGCCCLVGKFRGSHFVRAEWCGDVRGVDVEDHVVFEEHDRSGLVAVGGEA